MKRYLALDIGQKKTGIAVTDTCRIISSPLITIPSYQIEDFLKKYLSKNEVEKIIVGIPLQMNGEYSQSMKYIEPIYNRLKKVFKDIQFEEMDERFTSKMAIQTMLAAGFKKEKRMDKSTEDKISAAIILDSYLDKEKFEKKI